MRWVQNWFRVTALVWAAWASAGVDPANSKLDEISRHRNLGKAFYENPTTHGEAVEEFKKALDLNPDSLRDRLNYGLALLRAGKVAEGIAELEEVQKRDPKIPHTWFNLGIEFKKASDYERAIQQFQGMLRLVPNEPVSHYNLGALYQLAGKKDSALQQFQIAAKLDPNLAAPHFQLYNAYRQSDRSEDARAEYEAFQEIRKRQAGAAIPEDLDWSSYSEIYDPPEPENADEDSAAEIRLQSQTLADHIDPQTAGLTVLDFDGDGRPDLIAWSANGIKLLRDGSSLVQDSGLEDLQGVISISPGDFNNDGLPDLCVLTRNGAILYVNQKGRFQRLPVTLAPGQYVKAVWMDYDHDGDLDLFLLGDRSTLMRNDGQAGFSDQTATFPFVRGNALDGTVFRLVSDSKTNDLVVVYKDRAGVLYQDDLTGKYEAISIDDLPLGTTSVVANDVDQDGWIDLLASYASGVVLLLNRQGRFEKLPLPQSAKGPVTFGDLENRGVCELIAGGQIYRNEIARRKMLSKTSSAFPEATALVSYDFHGDGRADLVEVSRDGTLRLLENLTPTHNKWIGVGLAGVKNPKLAPGAEVEVKAGSLYQKKIYQGVPIVFGLRSFEEADTVRITWPNGLIQNEVKQPAGKSAIYKEAARLSGSCPMIFAWNGRRFEFITDVLGVAPLGASAGNGQYFPVNSREYVKIPVESLAQVDGRYEIRITEELSEVSYLDQVRLIAVDHPWSIDIFTNDKFKSPPFPEFRLYGIKRRIYPISAHDEKGRNMMGPVLKRDHVYPDSFRRDSRGVADLHYLNLDFSSTASNNRALLVLNGWVDWADGSTFLAVAQEKKDLVPPYLQVRDASGRWRTVIEDMGLPAGKPKTMVVDLTGKFLSASREVRIVTNLCVYWDEVFLSPNTGSPTVQLTAMDAETAELHFRGYSKATIHPERKQPESFDYGEWMPTSMWNPTAGQYTQYGDVRPLLTSVDDRFVIMGSGDELTLLFPVRNLPALKKGWKRDFLLLVDGWAKDADANTAYSQTVEPLPFHAMTAYPYSDKEHFPADEMHRSYQQYYNTRPALRLLRPLRE